MRQPKGSVTVESFQGWLRLRLPRHVFNGEQKRIALSLPDNKHNRKIADARAKEIESDIVLGRFDRTLVKYRPYSPDAIPGLPPINELWGKYTQYKSKTLSHATITKDFKKTANHIAALPTQDLNHAKIIKRHLVNNLSPDAARRCLVQIRACCEWAEEQELIPLNPFVKLPKLQATKNKGINPFTEKEMNLIITAFEINRYYKYYAPFVQFLFLTGCRTSEAIALKWRQIDPDLTTITFSEAIVLGKTKSTKTGKVRKFPANESLRILLSTVMVAGIDPDALVFPSPEGKAIDSHNFLERAWKTILETLPIVYRSVYNTRHTFITLCLEKGVTVQQVANWVGNSPKTIYQHYAGIASTVKVPTF